MKRISFAVGLLWVRLSPTAGLLYAGALTLAGGVVLFMVRNTGRPKEATAI